MIQTRKLGYWETTCRFAHDLVHGTGTVVAIAKVAGLIEFSTLRKAIFQLFERHPLLKTTLKTKHDGAYFYTDANFDSVPITYLQQQVEDEWQQIVEKELKATFQNDSVLWRITILSSIGAKEHHFIISAHHAIADALSLVSLTHDLLIFYESQLRSKIQPKTPLPFLPNIEKLLNYQNDWDNFLHHKKQTENLPVDKWDYASFVPIKDRTTRVMYSVLEPTQLKHLIDGARSNHTTVNAALNATMMLTACELYERELNILLSTPVNLRPYCYPSLSQTHIGCYISMVKTIHENIKSTMDFWDLARDYQEHLKNKIPQLGFLPANFDFYNFDSHELMDLFGMRNTSRRSYFSDGFGVSNIGKIMLNPPNRQLKVTSFYFCTNRQVGDFVIFLNVATLNNKMHLSFCYVEPLVTHEFAERFLKKFMLLLPCHDS